MNFKIAIQPNGTVTFIYSDLLVDLLVEGNSQVKRVSMVEPAGTGGWLATMSDGTVLGSFPLRAEALAAEVAWLERKMF